MSSHVASSSTARSGIAGAASTSSDYQMIVPSLPTGEQAVNAVFLHGDPAARPYRVDDLGESLSKVIDMRSVAGLGAFHFNHLWICELKDAKTYESLSKLPEITVKGQRCIIIDTNVREKEIKVHWLPICIPDKTLVKYLEPYGTVKKVVRVKWRRPGFEEIEMTTRLVTLVLKEKLSADDIPRTTSRFR